MKKSFLLKIMIAILALIGCQPFGGKNYVAKQEKPIPSAHTTTSAATPDTNPSTLKEDTMDTPSNCPAALNFEVQAITLENVSLCQYKGSVVMIINTASKCGFTNQYAGLQKIYETYHDRGFEILAFPANNFMNQEPGSNSDIQQFCTTNFHVTFPVFGKISVKGKDIHPLYKYLTEVVPDSNLHGEIQWNFQKFILRRDGTVVARFKPSETPDSEGIVSLIEQLLSE